LVEQKCKFFPDNRKPPQATASHRSHREFFAVQCGRWFRFILRFPAVGQSGMVGAEPEQRPKARGRVRKLDY
jgi:hypothetical protein